MRCKVCDTPSERVFEGTLLKKHKVAYYRCPTCGFLQTEEPYWLEEAYSSAISDLDLGPVNRAFVGARIAESTIVAGFDPNAKFLDWGGGYGVFTRLMRDMGYDFYWHDAYCQNLFAKQFVADMGESYELMTAFEVFEHLVQPMAEIEKMLKLSFNILFTTLIQPSGLANATEWWYLTPEHGQHISLFSIKSLEFVAKTFDLHLSTDGVTLHLLSRKPFSNRIFRMIARDRKASQMIRRIGRNRLRKHSLLMQDVRAVTGWNV